jgi:Flp pilus assembly protein TadG
MRRAFTRLRRRASDARGGAAVEFALVAAPFLALLFAIIETAMVFYAGATMEAAVQDAARQVRIGQARTEAEFRQALCARIGPATDCGAIEVEVRPIDGFADAQGWSPGPGGFNPGQAGQIILASARHERRLIAPDLGLGLANRPGNRRLITAASAFRNEPF